MYESFYGLTEKPFNLTPDPRFLFLSEKHKEAFAHLLYGIKNRSGFIMVSGEIGTGKTTICRSLLNQLDSDVEIAFIFNPCLSPEELLRKINEDFGIESRAQSLKELIDELNEYLLDRNAKGKNCVLVIDEAQNLSPGVLEQIRLLSNLETETQKLLQIVLIGQPELAMHLELPELRQLNQRITARYHLKPLNREETVQYLAYRLRVVGGRRKVHFTRGAMQVIFKASAGTPRVINALADRALLIGYTKEARDISKKIARRAVYEIRGESFKPRKRLGEVLRRFLPNPALVSSAVVIMLLAAGLVRFLNPVPHAAAPLPDAPDVVPLETSHDIAEAKTIEPAPVPPVPVEMPAAVPAPAPAPAPVPVPVSAPVAATPAPVAAFAKLDADTARNAAITGLLHAWNMAAMGDYPSDESPSGLVAFANAHGLMAEVLTPALEQLAMLNLPALTRIKVDGRELWVALVGGESGNVRVTTEGASTVVMPLDVFRAFYNNQAVVFWRDETPYAKPLWIKTKGPEVESLQRSLHALQRLQGDVTGVYTEETARAIARIQAETGLVIDGITGRQVRMVMSSWLSGPEIPSLRPKTLLAREESPAAPATPVKEAAAPVASPDKPSEKTAAVASESETPAPAPTPEPAPVSPAPEAAPAPAPEAAPPAPVPAPEPAPAPLPEAAPAPVSPEENAPAGDDEPSAAEALPGFFHVGPSEDEVGVASPPAMVEMERLPEMPSDERLSPLTTLPKEATPPVTGIVLVPRENTTDDTRG